MQREVAHNGELCVCVESEGELAQSGKVILSSQRLGSLRSAGLSYISLRTDEPSYAQRRRERIVCLSY